MNSTGSSLSPAEGMQSIDLTKLNLMQEWLLVNVIFLEFQLL